MSIIKFFGCTMCNEELLFMGISINIIISIFFYLNSNRDTYRQRVICLTWL